MSDTEIEKVQRALREAAIAHDVSDQSLRRAAITRVSWKECARRVPMCGPIRRIEDRISRRQWSSEIYHPNQMDPRVVSAIESGFRAWSQGRRGDPDTMAVLELFVSRWDSGLESRDAELAFDLSVLAVAIEPDPPPDCPGGLSDQDADDPTVAGDVG